MRVYTVQAHEGRAAQMHCMYTAQKQNVQKIISLRILVVSRVKCVKLEAHNIKKKISFDAWKKAFSFTNDL